MTQTQLSTLCGALHTIGHDSDESIDPKTMAKLADLGMVAFIGARVELTELGNKVYVKIESGDPEDSDLSADFA
jgi:hypothetical protein